MTDPAAGPEPTPGPTPDPTSQPADPIWSPPSPPPDSAEAAVASPAASAQAATPEPDDRDERRWRSDAAASGPTSMARGRPPGRCLRRRRRRRLRGRTHHRRPGRPRPRRDSHDRRRSGPGRPAPVPAAAPRSGRVPGRPLRTRRWLWRLPPGRTRRPDARRAVPDGTAARWADAARIRSTAWRNGGAERDAGTDHDTDPQRQPGSVDQSGRQSAGSSIASASISTFQRGSSRPATTSIVLAGRISPKTRP